MSEERGAIIYVLQEHKGAPLKLCVMDQDREQFHIFPLSILNASRLVAECGGAVNSYLGGEDLKFAHQELALLWAKK